MVQSFRILVTGSSGFVGQALVPALAFAGHHVRAAARSPNAHAAESAFMPDITRPIDWMPLVDGMDMVVHLAAIAHQPYRAISDYMQANTAAVADLVRACKRANVKRLVFLSSIGVQTTGAADHILTESDCPSPSAIYGQSKLAAEKAVRESELDYIILRPTIVLGPRPVANVAQLLKIARLRLPLPFGRFLNRRSMLVIDNLISAILFAMSAPTASRQTFIVANPDIMSLREIFVTLRQAEGRSPCLINVPPVAMRAALKLIGKGAIWEKFGTELVASPQKLMDAGWRPTVTMGQGLRAMIRAESNA